MEKVAVDSDTRLNILEYAIKENINEKEAVRQLITKGYNEKKYEKLKQKRGDELLKER